MSLIFCSPVVKMSGLASILMWAQNPECYPGPVPDTWWPAVSGVEERSCMGERYDWTSVDWGSWVGADRGAPVQNWLFDHVDYRQPECGGT